MKASRRPEVALRADGGSSTARNQQRDERNGGEPGGGVPLPPGVISYRGIRGLKHRNDRLQRPATTTTPPAAATILNGVPAAGKIVATPQPPPRQDSADHRSSSFDQRRPVQSPSSRRRSASADRHQSAAAACCTTSTPRTLFETLYHDKVCLRRGDDVYWPFSRNEMQRYSVYKVYEIIVRIITFRRSAI